MSKVVINGESVVITSSLKLDDIKLLEKYRPEALVLYDGSGDSKEPVFAVGSTNGHGSINNCGASFGKTAVDGTGFASITMMLDCDNPENIREKVADTLGVSILRLNKVEEQAPAAIEEIAAEKAAILGNITIA